MIYLHSSVKRQRVIAGRIGKDARKSLGKAKPRPNDRARGGHAGRKKK